MPLKLWLSPRAQRIAEAFHGDAEQAMRHHARRLLARANIPGPPYYPDMLARYCGVRDILHSDITQDGLLVRNGDGFSIHVNRRYPIRSGQWNAICAHEIGHALLLQTGDAHRSGASTEEEENLCDLAGRELLLPMRAFTSLVGGPSSITGPTSSGDGFSLESLRRLAEIFRTPPRMTAVRLVESGLWKGLVMQWKPVGKTPERLALDWWFPAAGRAAAGRAAARLLRRGVASSALFGKDNRVEQAWRENAPTFGLESVHARPRALWWFVRSGRFEEYGARYVLSLVRFE